jgi:alkyl hydroperoxide reductase subunit AhpC
LRGDHQQFVKAETQVLAVSVDHIWAHKAYAKSLGDLPFPLLADWDKSVSRRYGVLLEARGVAQRSLFLIDYRGYVRWRNPHYDWRSQEQYSEMSEAMLALPMIPRSKPATPDRPPQGGAKEKASP